MKRKAPYGREERIMLIHILERFGCIVVERLCADV